MPLTPLMLVVQALLSRFGAPRLLAAHLLRSGMQVSEDDPAAAAAAAAAACSASSRVTLQVRVLLVSLLRTSLSAVIN
jgi:hypothetical protein